MRILVIHSFYKPGLPSGENDVVRSQVELLRREGHKVELWGPTSPDEMSLHDQIRTGLHVALGKGANPLEMILKFRPDLIHIHNTFPNIGLGWIAKCATPIVMTMHNYRTVCANGVLIRKSEPCTDCLGSSSAPALKHACYRDSRLATIPVLGFQKVLRNEIRNHLKLTIFTSELSAEVLQPLLQPKDSAIIPNFVPRIEDRMSSPKKSMNGFFLVLGRLSQEKGIAPLIRDWDSSKRLVIVGDGPQRIELEQLAENKNVEFTGFLDSNERDLLLKEASALILPSVTLEADPVVVAQALSAGTPCVVNAQTASARLARDSPAVQTYSDQESMSLAFEALSEISNVSSAASQLYSRRWSDEAWISRFEHDVLDRLAISGHS